MVHKETNYPSDGKTFPFQPFYQKFCYICNRYKLNKSH